MSYRAAALWLGIALLVIAAVAAAVPVHANGIGCGSVLQPYSSASVAQAEIADTNTDLADGTTREHPDYAADCSNRRGSQQTLVIPLALIGALAAGFVLLTKKDSQTKAV